MNGMRQSHRSLHPPSCRRFALDLEKQELMEVSRRQVENDVRLSCLFSI